MPLSFRPLPFRGNYSKGRFIAVRKGRSLFSEDPGDLDCPVGRVRSDSRAVDSAVKAARKAFSPWQETPFSKRLACIRRYQGLLKKRRRDLAWVISRETGKPWTEALNEVQSMIAKVDFTLRQAMPLVAERTVSIKRREKAVVRHRPRGVVAVIGPFNVPGHLPNGQMIPALLTGNTVVFKPSEFTPFVGQIMAECFHGAGIPPGVFNLVQGDGRVGARLVSHPGVDAVFFTGSVPTGRQIQKICMASPEKFLALEMGGKNAALIFPDAPLEWTVQQVLHGAFSTSGQRCSSTSRILLHRSVSRRFLNLFLKGVRSLRVGYFTEDPAMGPLVNAAAFKRYFHAQSKARKSGFVSLHEGQAVALPRRGYYVGPSVHLWKNRHPPKARGYWDEELFVPDVAIALASSEEQMVQMNNASRYGLIASVFTRSKERFRRLATRLQNGVVHWNRSTAMTPGQVPFGGIKASGNHWPAGISVVQACTYPVSSVEVSP